MKIDLKSFWKKEQEIPSLKIWILLLIIPIICYSLYLYTDIIETTSNSLKIWYLILGEGELREFYTYRYPLIENAPQAGYDFFIYVIFAIWNIPLFIFEKITAISYIDCYLTTWYAKSIIIFFLVLSARQVYKISILVCDDETKAAWSVFCYIFSVLVFQTIGVMGGYDIISVAFTLYGITAYLQNKNKPFLFFFSCAIACKLFAVWIFVPLVLLRYKSIIKIAVAGVAGLAMVIVPKVAFPIANYIHVKLTEVTAVTSEVVNTTVDTVNVMQSEVVAEATQIAEVTQVANSGGTVISHTYLVNNFIWGGEAPIMAPAVPSFFFYTFILWAWCWFNRKKLSNYQVIFVSLLGMGIFLLTCNTYPYWFILIAPYIAILICTSWENMSLKLFLETCSGISYILIKSIRNPQCYNYNLVVNMLHNEEQQGDFCYLGLYTFLNKACDMIGLDIDYNIRTMATAVFAASTVMLLWYLRKDNVKETRFVLQDTKYFYWKALCCIAVSMIPLLGVVAREMLG